MRKPLLPKSKNVSCSTTFLSCFALVIASGLFFRLWQDDIWVERSVGSVFLSNKDGQDFGDTYYSTNQIDTDTDKDPNPDYDPCTLNRDPNFFDYDFKNFHWKKLGKPKKGPVSTSMQSNPEANPKEFKLQVEHDGDAEKKPKDFEDEITKTRYSRAHYVGTTCTTELWQAICAIKDDESRSKAKKYMLTMTFRTVSPIKPFERNPAHLKWGNQAPTESNIVRWGDTKSNWQIHDGFDPVVSTSTPCAFDTATRDWLRIMAYVSDKNPNYRPCAPRMTFEAASEYVRSKGLNAIRWKSEFYPAEDEEGNSKGYRTSESVPKPADFEDSDPKPGEFGNVDNLEKIQFYSSGKFAQDGAEQAPPGSFTFGELSDLDKNLFLNAYWKNSFLSAKDQSAHKELKERLSKLEDDVARRNFIERHP